MFYSKPSTGERIKDLVLIEMVGRGGFGEVWKAVPAYGEGRPVAVKFARLPRYSDYLRREGKILSRLNHPGIVRILGLDPSHDPPYLVRELVEGESLRGLLSRGTPSLERVVDITRQILAALEYAHEMGILHGDLKPENIIIDRLGRIKLTDFGIGRFTGGESSSLVDSLRRNSSRNLSLAGTLNYMAPEQKIPGKRIDSRADIFSLGVVFFELLTGEVPQGGEVPSDLRPSLPPEADRFFRNCYTRLGRRYPTARKARKDLESLAERIFKGEENRPEAGFKREESMRDLETFLGRVGVIHESAPATGRARQRNAASPAAPRPEREGKRLKKEAHTPAGFCLRTVAFMIDLLLLYLLQHLLLNRDFIPARFLHSWPSYPFSHMLGLLPSPYPTFKEWFASLGLSVPFVVAYFTLATWLWSRTFGKFIMGIKVVGENGERVGFFGSLLRVFGYYLNVLTHGIGFLLILFTPGKRGLHDYISQSRVVEG